MRPFYFVLMYPANTFAVVPSIEYAYDCVMRYRSPADRPYSSATIVEIEAVDVPAAIAGLRAIFA